MENLPGVCYNKSVKTKLKGLRQRCGLRKDETLTKKPKFTLQLQYNSPVILTFFLLSLGVLFLGQWERVQAVAALFEGTGVHFRATEHIREEMWSKFRLNVCNNLPQAILGAGVGCYRDSVHMKAISDGLRKELMAIAAAKGIDLSIVDKNSGRGSAVPPDARYSTLQDIDAGRHTEIDMFSGALMRMGKELGIPTPYNEYTYHMIKALEEKNDGLFDYSGKDQEPTWAK